MHAYGLPPAPPPPELLVPPVPPPELLVPPSPPLPELLDEPPVEPTVTPGEAGSESGGSERLPVQAVATSSEERLQTQKRSDSISSSLPIAWIATKFVPRFRLHAKGSLGLAQKSRFSPGDGSATEGRYVQNAHGKVVVGGATLGEEHKSVRPDRSEWERSVGPC